MNVPSNPVSTWSDYFAASRVRPAHFLYDHLESLLGPPGRAIELACGAGQGVAWLLERGWSVDALDGEPEALSITRERVGDDPRLRLSCGMLQDWSPAATYDLVVAGFCLFFLPPSDFPGVWARIVGALPPGGLFMGQFLGPNDDWQHLLRHTEADVRELMAGFEVVYWQEADQDGKTAQGFSKHWHVFHVIARKR